MGAWPESDKGQGEKQIAQGLSGRNAAGAAQLPYREARQRRGEAKAAEPPPGV